VSNAKADNGANHRHAGCFTALRIMNRKWIRKEAIVPSFAVLTRYMPGGAEDHHEISQSELKTEFLLNNKHKDSVCTSQETHYLSTTKPDRLMLFRETVAICRDLVC
jgi:hypothetical protein